MKRLTKRNQDGEAYYPYCFLEETCDGMGISSKCEICEHEQWVIEKLADYEDAEEQGQLLRLPCKVGDRFYVIAYSNDRVIEVECIGIDISLSEKIIWIANVEQSRDYWKLRFEDFKIQYFSTREEAEAKLKKME